MEISTEKYRSGHDGDPSHDGTDDDEQKARERKGV
jgi:hypothetical protein